MDAREFLHLAQRFSDSSDAAGRRTAISRAYYSLGFRIARGHAAHEAVQVHLRNSGVQSVISIGAGLRRLQHLRTQADYWLRDPHPENPRTVSLGIREAARMIGTLDAAAADPATRERMTRAIQAWEQRRVGDPR